MSTPLMKQYAQVKSRYPGTILLFRMGDFFETFEEDARVAAKVLGITLTKRRNGAAGEIPLAGFPHHALDSYLPKFLKAGHRVAVCEQLEDPRAAKGIVKRDVVEVVTPGVSFSEKVLERKQNNYLAAVALPSAIAGGDAVVGLSYIDVSTGEFATCELPMRQLPEQVSTLAPSEILVQARDADSVRQILRSIGGSVYTKVEDWVFDRSHGEELLRHHFKTHSLKGFGLAEHHLGVIAAGCVMYYLQETQKANLDHITRVVPLNLSEHIVLDPATRRNLEITSQISGEGNGSLISILDKTRTPMGARLFHSWISRPLNTLAPILGRLEAVSELVVDTGLQRTVSSYMTDMGDLERLNARICTGRAGPREVSALSVTLGQLGPLRQALEKRTASLLASTADALDSLPTITDLVGAALAPDPPAVAGPGTIKPGFHPELDELRELASSGKEWIGRLQHTERERTGIGSLKIGFNNVFGYYIEVTNTHREKIPDNYLRKQTLTNAERYVTPELKEYEEKVLHAEEKILSLESLLFDDLRKRIAAHAATIQCNARAVATIDCLVSAADAAVEYRYVRPDVNESTRIEIEGGRHPVIERLLPPGEKYTANNTILDTAGERILIITGPNMSGKSSYLRQTGLIVLMAQIGCFVPAERASVGLVDRIFTRVGASDNIASGESTFLVEMHEAAHIVNTATSRSLVLLDEIGRGTSTFDGISIAWALTEYLHARVGARTLFATHYHELNQLADLYDGIRNYKVDVREYGDRVVFLHKVLPGFADHSYGIQVAQMAGLPDQVTDRAKEILRSLESSGLNLHGTANDGGTPPAGMQMTMFEPGDAPLRALLETVDIDTLTPLEALKKLAELKETAGR